MPNPAGQRPATPSTTEPAGSRDDSGSGLHPRIVAREFARLFRERGIDVHPAAVRRKAQQWLAEEHERLPDDLTPLWYADPTGETVVRGVMRGRS